MCFLVSKWYDSRKRFIVKIPYKKFFIACGLVLLVQGAVIYGFATSAAQPTKSTAPPLQQNTTITHPAPPPSDITIENLFNEVNSERIKAGLSPLTLNYYLNQSAADKCADMAEYNYWAHENPNGTSPWYFVGKYVRYRTAGENLAKEFHTTAGLVRGWMSSPTHRDNIVKPEFTQVGYGICEDETYKTIVVQHLVGF